VDGFFSFGLFARIIIIKIIYKNKMINEKIFKAYDIRGIYPTELNEIAAYGIGRALARKGIREYNCKKIVVGSDMRLSGPVLKKELIRGITDEGLTVVDIGLVSIDAAYACVGKFGYEAAVMITASHNPAEYNGFKMVFKDMNWVRGLELKDEVLNLPLLENIKKGEVVEVDILDDYIEHVLSFVDISKIKPFKVVVDAGNGMAGKIVPLLAKYLPVEIVPLNFELDGNFPAHPSNPLLPESQVEIKERTVADRANFGVIFDGDTDRLFFVDELGNFIRADVTLLLLAKMFLDREPGAGIVYNVICSKIVPEMIIKWGGRPIKSPAGYINIATNMREFNGIMGGELSAHYSFRDNAYSDSGFIAWLIIMQLLSEYDQPLSELVKPFIKYAKNAEINLTVTNIEEKLIAIKKYFNDGQQDFTDGVTVEYDNWWANIRPSNTEPLLRVTVEADNEQLLQEKTALVLQIIQD
jgi:phosphomannomutase